MEQTEKGKRGRPNRRYMDAVRKDLALVEVTDEDADHRNRTKLTEKEYPLWRPLAGEEVERRRALEVAVR